MKIVLTLEDIVIIALVIIWLLCILIILCKIAVQKIKSFICEKWKGDVNVHRRK